MAELITVTQSFKTFPTPGALRKNEKSGLTYCMHDIQSIFIAVLYDSWKSHCIVISNRCCKKRFAINWPKRSYQWRWQSVSCLLF